MLGRAILPSKSSAPASPVAGQLYFDTGTNTLNVYSGSAWLAMPPVASPTFTGTTTVATLAATTINGAAMSGTFTGAHTYSGALTLSSAGTALTVTNNATVGGTSTVTGISMADGGLRFSKNLGGTNPYNTDQAGNGFLGWNMSGGGRDSTFFNIDWSATSSFRWYQATGASSNVFLAEIKPNGDTVFRGSVFPGAAGPTMQTTYYIYADTGIPKILTNASGGFGAVSDRKLKTNIVPIDSALEKVCQLKGVSFQWKEDGRTDIGLIAQDVAKVFPEVASKSKDMDGKGTTWTLSHGPLVGALVEAIKEQQAIIEALNARVENLEA